MPFPFNRYQTIGSSSTLQEVNLSYPEVTIEIDPEYEKDINSLPVFDTIANIYIGIPTTYVLGDVAIYNASASIQDFKDIDGITDISGAVKGDITQYNGRNWIKRGNLSDFAETIGTINPPGISFTGASNNNIFIFNADVNSGLTWKDTDGSGITSAIKGDIAQHNGTNWIRVGTLDLDNYREYIGNRYDVFFNWGETVNDFDDVGDVVLKINNSENKSIKISNPDSLSIGSVPQISLPISHGSAAVYRSVLTIPNGYTNSFDIIVKKDAAVGRYNKGPVNDTSKLIKPNSAFPTSCPNITAGTGITISSNAELSRDLMGSDGIEYLNSIITRSGSGNAGGLFNGVLECKTRGSNTFMVVQIIKQNKGFLRSGEQAGAALIRNNGSTWTLIKAYNNILTAARSLRFIRKNSIDYLYFFEGSHYSYLPQAEFRNGNFILPRRVDLTNYVRVSDIVSLEFDNDDKLKAANAIDEKVNRALQRNLPSEFNINIVLYRDIHQLLLEGKSQGDIIEYINKRLTVFLVPGYSDEWKSQIGNLCRVRVDGTNFEVIGNNWRSATTEDNPEHDNNPDYFYGIHGGTASPIIEDNGDINIIAGYGDLYNLNFSSTLEELINDVNRVNNWQWVQYSDNINHKLPLLLTNERSPLDILNDIAVITNSIYGIENDEFFMNPRDPRKANLNANISNSVNTISIDSHNWTANDYPSSGTLLIDSELIDYTGLGSNASSLTGATRGKYGTTADSHLNDAEVLWIDHYISLNMQVIQKPIQGLNITSQSEHLYNHIVVNYGNGKKAESEDENSINANRKKTLTLSTVLDNHQLSWAQWIADSYLKRFKDIHYIIDLELKTTFYMKLGEIVVIEQQDRAHLKNKPCQILEITQNPSQQITNLKLVTL